MRMYDYLRRVTDLRDVYSLSHLLYTLQNIWRQRHTKGSWHILSVSITHWETIPSIWWVRPSSAFLFTFVTSVEWIPIRIQWTTLKSFLNIFKLMTHKSFRHGECLPRSVILYLRPSMRTTSTRSISCWRFNHCDGQIGCGKIPQGTLTPECRRVHISWLISCLSRDKAFSCSSWFCRWQV